MNFGDIVEAAKAPHYTSAKDIRLVLPVGYVLQKHGIDFTEVGDKLAALCPFHADTEESFDVFGEHLEFWGCHPCYGGIGGDVVDLIRAFEGWDENDTPLAVDRANELIIEMSTDGYSGPREGKAREQLDIMKASKFVTRAFNEANISLLDAFCQLKQFKYGGQYLHEQFGIGTWADWIVIPFYNQDGELAAYKRRTIRDLAKRPRAAKGADFDELFYNHWRLTNDITRTVVLCEGESDTWTTHADIGDRFTVLGIPTGAGDEKEHKEPPQTQLLAGRKVILAFDGDSAGRAARQAWDEALSKYECEVLFAPVPEGKDMSTVDSPAAIIELATRTLISAPTEIMVEPNSGYARPGKGENGQSVPLSNWHFKANRELVGDSGLAYEGHMEPGHTETILSSFDLSSKSKTVAWATRHGRAWYGADRDAQLLLGLLQSEGPFLMSGRMATVAGLNERHFVFPSGKIGPDYWKYVRPSADVHLDTKIHIEEGSWTPQMIHTLRRLHRQDVMDPFLAWLAIAPLRSLLREFPPLSITGSSGTGKTTLTETIIQAFSGTSIANNLTSTTKHALFAYLGCTNAFPVWFDEYRPGARKDALITLEQIIRDAYTGQASSKGGMGEHWAEVMSVATHAPLVVTGEDAFNETSHTERMILLVLPMDGRDPDVLREVRSWGDTGLPYAYLQWLQRGLMAGTLPEIVNYSTGAEGLPPRQRLNMGVLYLGWQLLTAFLNDQGEHLPAPDFSLITREAMEAMEHAPIEDALRWCLEEPDAGQFIFMRDDGEIPGEKILCVRVENFVSFIEQRAKGIYTLPGGVTAVRRHLVTKYGAETRNVAIYGSEKRVLAVQANRLNWR